MVQIRFFFAQSGTIFLEKQMAGLLENRPALPQNSISILNCYIDFLSWLGQFAGDMKVIFWRRLGGCALGVALFAGRPADAQTVWGYKPTNAFPSLVFSNPVCLTTPPGETNRLFIVEKHGRIIVITNLAGPTRTMFLDISGRVKIGNSSESLDVNSEEGLLGLAFHPNYAANGFFYVFYTRTNGGGRDDTLSRFQVAAGNPNQADAASEVRLIQQPDSQPNHNGGDIHFGPDGYLYVPLGDEGGSNDNQNNSQLITNDFFSAILRLDVDKLPGNLNPHPHPAIIAPTNYAIPADNPFIGATTFNGTNINPNQVRTEFWVVGFRNPWRMTYDPPGARWYCADVGQGAREEIDILQRGSNYGWVFREGTVAGPKSAPIGFVSTGPIIDYGHTNGGFGNRIAVIGGLVYRDFRLPQLAGAYIYGDYGSGEIWALRDNGTSVTTNQFLFADAGVSAFGTDPRNGDILYANLKSGNNSIIQRIITTNTVPYLNGVQLSGTNLIGSGIISGVNGAPGRNYFVLTSANLTLPAANWGHLSTNVSDSGGNIQFTNGVGPGQPRLFYLLQLP
jgi:glucose/arabinose dehydrogenase